jgi:uracil-DNA glycosylase
MNDQLDDVLAAARRCNLCAPVLPLGPRPILQASRSSTLLIVGQAPGTRAHLSGIPWDDNSGTRLRLWLGLEPEVFYDATRVAIVPAGFCYPGAVPKGGDNPPRPECAPLWHPQILPLLENVELTILVGGYAQRLFLGSSRARTLTETVADFARYLPAYLPLPHPSWRSLAWEKKHPWFTSEVLTRARALVQDALST